MNEFCGYPVDNCCFSEELDKQDARIEALEHYVYLLEQALVEAMIVPEAWTISGYPDISEEAIAQIKISVRVAREVLMNRA